MHSELPYFPLKGKTYSLFGDSGHTRGFYITVNDFVDECLDRFPDTGRLLSVIRANNDKRRRLKKLASKDEASDTISYILRRGKILFSPYTVEVENHLKNLSLKKLWDRRLGTTREQYFLHILEFALVNRINKNKFLSCDKKIALLPYCLQDFTSRCQAEPDEYDYRCKHCSKNCYQNQVTRLLLKHAIDPYIWMESEFENLYKKLNPEGHSLGILGIACLPELANGMHLCARYNIPVVGIPLDANRCIRWWGEFFPNSVNLEELEKLIS